MGRVGKSGLTMSGDGVLGWMGRSTARTKWRMMRVRKGCVGVEAELNDYKANCIYLNLKS